MAHGADVYAQYHSPKLDFDQNLNFSMGEWSSWLLSWGHRRWLVC